jgi:hypothetical protein
MRKRTEKQKLIDKLDDVFQMCIRYRDNFTCITCGKKFPRGERVDCHAGHYIGRGNYSTRWDEENVNCQCRSCNLKQSNNDAEIWHEYEKQLELKYGRGTVERLIQKKHQIFKYNKGWMLDMIDFYEKALKNYEEQ